MRDSKGRGEQYFEQEPTSERKPRRLAAELRGERFAFLTDAGVFSPDRIDRGTELLIEHMELPDSGQVLDWGAGYGAIGIVAARLRPRCHVMLAEVNERAVALLRENVKLNRVPNTYVLAGDAFGYMPDLTFDVILINPPIRAGKQTVFRAIEESALSLRPGGSFWLVGQRKQGVLTIAQRMSECFAQVETMAKRGGYRVLRGLLPPRAGL